MPVRHALLGLLARSARHGYELRRALEEEIGPEWRLDFGQLYRLLGAMRRKAWIAARTETGARGPDRKVYALTQRGRAELTHWLQQPTAEVVRGRDALSVKLRFGHATGATPVDSVLAERRRQLEARHHAERLRCDRARQARDSSRWLAAETRRRHAEGALAALDSCVAVAGSGVAPRATHEDSDLIAIGSDDPVVDLLRQFVADAHPEIRFSTVSVGSLDGLIALRDRRAHLAGIHLLDVDSGAYNVPFIKHLLPDEPVRLVHLAQREQGLMVPAGNPRGIRRLRDISRRGIRLINRQPGAGTRLLLYQRLRAARIDPHSIDGYDRVAPTHNAVAAAIAAGSADVGPGLRAVADAWGLAFIPLGQEPYELAVPRQVCESRRLRALLEVLHHDAFRQAAAALSGYDFSRMSEIVADIH